MARDHFLNLMTVGVHEPIEQPGDWSSTTNVGPPAWFNEQKFDLGREYFMNNRFGILNTNLCGLVLLLAVPRGLAMLRATNRSNTVDTSRNRYLDTIMHTLSWYEVQLKNDSRWVITNLIVCYILHIIPFMSPHRSWESLQRVRRYHLHASGVGQSYNIGSITQTHVAMTTFGFAGLALIRPYLFGIDQTNQKQRKAFLHFWAVLNYLIGVKDRYNIGLLPIKAAEIEFDIIMRNVLSPYLQLETLPFKRMVSDLVEGLAPYMDNVDYESQMFLVKRAVGIPGYQLDVNYTREVPYGNILSRSDVAEVRKVLPRFSEKIQIYTVLQHGTVQTTDCQSFYADKTDPYDLQTIISFDTASFDQIKKLMGLMCPSEIRLKEVDRGPSYLRYLSHHALYNLPQRSQFYVNLFLALVSLMKLPKGMLLANQIIDARLDAMRKKTPLSWANLNLNRNFPEMYVRGPGI